ncbi:hypothetical protein [Streptomyces sp. ALB3]|uniref:hypothetical protein n=1 Tax=Streptomyces sp. ALB3 TaxID=3374278 RepID=UPI003793E8F0
MSGRRRRTSRVLVWASALLVSLSACGGAGGRSAEVSAAAAALERSLADGDRAATCAALAPETLGEVEEAEKKACVDAIGTQDLPPGGRVRAVDVYGRQARAVLASDTLFLSRFPDGWKIVAAGCRPSRPDRPYQCSVEGG